MRKLDLRKLLITSIFSGALVFQSFGQAIKLFDFEDGVKPEDIAAFSIGTANPDPDGAVQYLSVATAISGSWSWIGAATGDITGVDLSLASKILVSFDYNTGSNLGWFQVEVGDGANMKWGYDGGQLSSATWVKKEASLKELAFGNWGTDALDWSKVTYVKLCFTTGNLASGNFEVNVDNIFLKAQSQVLLDFEDGVKPEDITAFTIETSGVDPTGGTNYLKVSQAISGTWSWIGGAGKTLENTNVDVYKRPLVSFLYNTGANLGWFQVEVGDADASMKWGYDGGQLSSATWATKEVSLFDITFGNWGTDPLVWDSVTYIKIGFTTGNLASGNFEVNIDNITLKEAPTNTAPILSNFAKMGAIDVAISFAEGDFTSKFVDAEDNALTKVKIVSLPASGALQLDGSDVAIDDEIAVADIADLAFIPAAGWTGTTSFEWNAYDGELYAVAAATATITVTQFVNLALNKPVEASGEAVGWGNLKPYVNDGDKTTRWQATVDPGTEIEAGRFADTSWVYVNLEAPTIISAVVLYWEAAFAIDYNIEVSDNSTDWTLASAVTGANGELDRISLTSDTVQYVRIYTLVGNMQWYPSIFELEVYGEMPPAWSNFPIAKKIDAPNVANSDDWSGTVDMRWDADSIYMVFNIKDDSINTSISSDIWNVDNIEIYFDMNNGKAANWPRTSGWPPAYTNGEDGYHQLRVVPDSAWDKYNSLTGVNLKHLNVDGGYKFEVNFEIASLVEGFEAKIDTTVIGIDFLGSDNDADPNYRDQISWNAPNTLLYVDAAAWGALRLTEYGMFESVLDGDEPTTPGDVAATVIGNTATLTWSPSIDNIVVQNYIIYKGTTPVDTVVAKQTGNTATVTGLPAGQTNLSVAAVDLYWNRSIKGTVKVTITTGINDNSVESTSVFPNPASDVLNIRNVQEGTEISIYNIAGELVLSQVIDNDATIDISALNAGLYAIRISNNSIVSTMKLIKK